MSTAYMAYTGEGLEVGMLTVEAARERYESAEIETNDVGGRTITVGELRGGIRFATDYNTAKILGFATDRLALESDEAVGATNGVVSAYLDAQGRWEYLPESRVADFERMGRTVRGVYVLP